MLRELVLLNFCAKLIHLIGLFYRKINKAFFRFYNKMAEKTLSIKKHTLWKYSTFVLAILLVIIVISSFLGLNITGKTISETEAADSVRAFVNSQIDGELEIVEVNFDNGLYEVVFLINGEKSNLYLTTDGKNIIFPQGLFPLSLLEPEEEEEPQNTNSEISKSDKPVVELFVMTHCPYGTQAEKGLIPAIRALDDTIDAQIRFVHYFMHAPEESETPRQVCIREEQPDKFLDYLECFLEDGDFVMCLVEVGIDEIKLNTCIQNNAKGYYAMDSELSQNYGVQGSPALVINGKIISSARDPASYLDVICQAFNKAPKECGEQLSSTTPSPGFGWGAAGSPTSATC